MLDPSFRRLFPLKHVAKSALWKLIEQRAEDIQRALMLDESNAPDDAGETGAAAEGGEMP